MRCGLRRGRGARAAATPSIPAIPQAIVATGLHAAAVPVELGGRGAGSRRSSRSCRPLGAIDGSTALGFAMHLHVDGAAAESTRPGRRPRASACSGRSSTTARCVNAASTEEGGGSPARGAIPGTIATPSRWRRVAAHRGEDLDDVAAGPAVRPRERPDRRTEDADTAEVGVFLVDLEAAGVERLPGVRGAGDARLGVGPASADATSRSRPTRSSCAGSTAGPDPRGPAPAAWFAIAVAATYLGVGEGARDAVARWAIDRRPGDGTTAVADLPTVQLRLGRLDAALRAARIVLEDVARRWDAATDDEARRRRSSPTSPWPRSTATNAAALATEEALRIAGGPGFLAGRLERAFRDARAGLINPPLEDVALTGFGRAVVARHR